MGNVRCGSWSLTRKNGGKCSFMIDFSLPCSSLCQEKLKRNPPKRPHLNCLTCLERRYYYGKVNQVDYVKLKKNQPFMMTRPYSDVILPKNMRWYCLIINTTPSWGFKGRLKGFLTSTFLSLAEVFANW